MASRLEKALSAYRTALNHLEGGSPNGDEAVVLECLLARDAVARALSDRVSDPPSYLLELVSYDRRLRDQAQQITELTDLDAWRKSLSPGAEDWWWFLDREQEARESKADVLWTLVAVVFFTLSLSLVLDVSRRFLTPGPDFWGLLATVSQAVFGLLVVGGALTQIGQKSIDRIFEVLGIGRHHQQEWKAGLSLLLFVVLAAFWLSLPLVARFYNDAGVTYQHRGQLTSAIDAYRRAVSLNPRHAIAHFNLAVAYEEQQRYDDAIKAYQSALESQAELDVTYNNLARLYIIRKKDYGAAVELLLRGSSLAQDDETRHAIARNLGWAYLMLGRHGDAERELRDAIALKPDRAAAHCLLAQTLEERSAKIEIDPGMILDEWRDCLAFGPDETKFEENTWASMARQKLEAAQ
jgi:tetratricopeptide (TPR) repeat protein